MNYLLVKDVTDLVQQFDIQNERTKSYETSVEGFKEWISSTTKTISIELDWE